MVGHTAVVQDPPAAGPSAILVGSRIAVPGVREAALVVRLQEAAVEYQKLLVAASILSCLVSRPQYVRAASEMANAEARLTEAIEAEHQATAAREAEEKAVAQVLLCDSSNSTATQG